MVQPPPEPPPATEQPTQRRAVALVDDRRTVTVEADGTLRMPDVASGIELASLIVEAIDGRPLDVESCSRENTLGGSGASSFGQRPATFITADGEEVTGTIQSFGYDGTSPTFIVEDADGNAHFLRGEPEHAIIPGATALEVRCQVRAVAGEHRVRIVYATTDMSWTASYRIDLAVEGEAATAVIQPTFTIAGSALIGARRANVQLLVGLPGSDTSPRVAWQGEVGLGNDAVSVQPEARSVAAQFEHVYRGALPDQNSPKVQYWRSSFTSDVWAGIGIDAEVAGAITDLPAGPALVSVTRGEVTRQAEIDWPAPAVDKPTGFTVPLWPSADLFGFRERKTQTDDGQRLTEQYLLSVSNLGDEPIKVWIEEELRPDGRRKIDLSWPMKPERRGEILRFPVTIKPRRVEHVGFQITYQW